MKIGIIAPLWIRIPPVRYGGTEDVVHTLTEQLVAKGHDVTLFAPATTQTSAKLVSSISRPLLEDSIGWHDPAAITYHFHHYYQAFKSAHEFDILHVHLNKNHDYISLFLAENIATPVVFTLHFPAPTPNYRPEKYLVLSQFREYPFVSISDAARSGNKWNFVATVYNSVNLAQFPFSETYEDYYAWLGKALPIKGLKEAIIVAKKANVRLKIMAAIDTNNPVSIQYFENEVKPLIDGRQIIYLGEADMAMKTQVLGKAAAFINPIQWPEPFGLVMAEAMAVGTPVLTLTKGGAAEVVANGKTGFVCNTLTEMVEKVSQVKKLSRKACRQHVEEKFSPEKMTAAYEAVYKKLIVGHQ